MHNFSSLIICIISTIYLKQNHQSFALPKRKFTLPHHSPTLPLSLSSPLHTKHLQNRAAPRKSNLNVNVDRQRGSLSRSLVRETETARETERPLRVFVRKNIFRPLGHPPRVGGAVAATPLLYCTGAPPCVDSSSSSSSRTARVCSCSRQNGEFREKVLARAAVTGSGEKKREPRPVQCSGGGGSSGGGTKGRARARRGCGARAMQFSLTLLQQERERDEKIHGARRYDAEIQFII